MVKIHTYIKIKYRDVYLRVNIKKFKVLFYPENNFATLLT